MSGVDDERNPYSVRRMISATTREDAPCRHEGQDAPALLVFRRSGSSANNKRDAVETSRVGVLMCLSHLSCLRAHGRIIGALWHGLQAKRKELDAAPIVSHRGHT
jgi:hypothetical protein